jgi:hypothetical protein
MSDSSIEAGSAVLRACARDVVDLIDAKVLPVRSRWLRPPAFAAYIGVDHITLGNWRHEGTGPRYRKIGSRVVYDIQEGDRFIAQYPELGSGKLDIAEGQ